MSTVFGGENFSNWAHAPRKAPEEKVRHEVDFSDRVEDSDSISSVAWSSDPDGDLTFGSVNQSPETATAIIGGGQDGAFYRVSATADTADGLVLKRSFTMPVGSIYEEPESLTWRRAMFMTRQFLRDRPEANELDFGALESGEDDMKRAVSAALSDWNATPPQTSDDLAEFPPKARYLLYQGAAIEALQSAAQAETRNNYQYSDQGFSVEEHSQGGQYMQIAQRLNAQYEKKKRRFKATSNTHKYWGGMTIDESQGNGALGSDGLGYR